VVRFLERAPSARARAMVLDHQLLDVRGRDPDADLRAEHGREHALVVAAARDELHRDRARRQREIERRLAGSHDPPLGHMPRARRHKVAAPSRAGRRRRYTPSSDGVAMHWPPSTTSTWPVTYAAAGERRYTAAAAI